MIICVYFYSPHSRCFPALNLTDWYQNFQVERARRKKFKSGPKVLETANSTVKIYQNGQPVSCSFVLSNEMVTKLFRGEIFDFSASQGRRAKWLEAVVKLR